MTLREHLTALSEKVDSYTIEGAAKRDAYEALGRAVYRMLRGGQLVTREEHEQVRAALKAAETYVFDQAEARDYNPPVPGELVGDIAAALNGSN